MEISPTAGTFLYDLVSLGSPDGTAAGLPHDIIFDRCYLHGDPVKGTRRGIALNSGAAAVIDSHLSDFKEVGADSQAICGWTGPGPFKIANNYLEAAGENVMFGGADPSIKDLVPSDIEIARNHFAKPLTWKIGHPSYAGTALVGEEPLRTEERPARADRGKPVRAELGARASGFCDPVHRAKPIRQGALVRGARTSRSATTSSGPVARASTFSAGTQASPAEASRLRAS